MIDTDKKNLVKLVSAISTFDGGLYQYGNTNARFIMNMRAANSDYIEFVCRVLESITGVNVYDRTDYNTDGCIRSHQLRVESSAHPFLTKIRSRLYIDKHKVIDPHMLKLMDAELLAIIFMCDGGSRVYQSTRSKSFSSDISLNTKGFSYGDNLILSKAIYGSFGIRSTINKQNQYRYLRIKSDDHLKFINTIMPYVAPSFRYKIARLAPSYWGDDIVWTQWEHCDILGN